jgi:hypothetical protein
MIQVWDNFLKDPDAVRASALASGFGTWKPNKGDLGADSYGGVNFVGDHATCLKTLHDRLGVQIIPNSMFFRITNPSMERALIHSDREYGDMTAIIYLTPDPEELSGTGFYRHRQTGMEEMPPIASLRAKPDFMSQIRQEMLDAEEHVWEMYRFVEGRYNCCVFFSGPLIHCRIPMTGFGLNESDSRMVWVCHWNFDA